MSADSIAIATLGGAVKTQEVQTRLVTLGRLIGQRVVAMLNNTSPAADPLATAAPGTWEKEVLSPMMDPILRGFLQEAQGTIAMRAGLVGGAAALAIGLGSGFLGFRLGKMKCGAPPQKPARSSEG